MLVVSRKNTESILIRPEADIDPKLTLADLFDNGPIEITIFSSDGRRVTMGVQAPRELSIRRKDSAAA